MHGETALGWSAAWLATAVFAGTYALIISDKLNRAVLALLGAALLILCGVINQEAAIRGIDFNTIGLLLGMMLIVNITAKSGVFQYMAIWSAKRVNAQPLGVLFMLSMVTALLSALLDNVTTVLLVVPVTLLITEELKVKAYPYLIAEVLCSNIGGTATLIGDPPNIMIGSLVGIPFNDFLYHLTPVVIVVLLVSAVPYYFLWRTELVASEKARRRVMEFEEREAIHDWRLLRQALFVLALVLTGFFTSRLTHLEPATVSMGGAALLLLLDNFGKNAEEQGERPARVRRGGVGDADVLRRAVHSGARAGGVWGDPNDGGEAARGDQGRPDGDGAGGVVGVGDSLSVYRQHSLCGDDDSVDQEHGAGFWRGAGADAVVVGAVVRRVSGRQRNAGGRVGEPGGGGARRTGRTADQVRAVFEVVLRADDPVDRGLPRLHLLAILVSGRLDFSRRAVRRSGRRR